MIVVTGGAGFIGSVILHQLNQAGEDKILVVDHLDTSEKWKNLRGKRFVDYLDRKSFLDLINRNALPKLNAIVHFGACSATTERDADYLMENNYHYSKTLAEWSLANGVRMIYASSAATYGDGKQGFSDDPTRLADLRPLNIYGYSKHIFDLWAQRSGALNQMVGLKFFNVFGPNEYHKEEMSSVVCKAFHQLKETARIRLFKSYRKDFADGEQMRDFVYVKDCAKLTQWLLENRSAVGLLNLGSGRSRSWKDLAQAVFAAMGKPANIEYVEMPAEMRDRYQYRTEATLERLRALGYTQPFLSLEESVADYVKNYLAKDDPYI